jgi:hypothetical protein
VQDTDHDGLGQRTEFILGTDPQTRDTDLDGLPDGEEVSGWNIGPRVLRSNPAQKDSDDDGAVDLVERNKGTDPLHAGAEGSVFAALKSQAQRDPPYPLRLDIQFIKYRGFGSCVRPDMEAYIREYTFPLGCPAVNDKDRLLIMIQERASGEKPNEFFNADSSFRIAVEKFRAKVRTYVVTGEWPETIGGELNVPRSVRSDFALDALLQQANAAPPFYVVYFETWNRIVRPDMEAYIQGFSFPPNCPGSDSRDHLLKMIQDRADQQELADFFNADNEFRAALQLFRAQVRTFALNGEWPSDMDGDSVPDFVQRMTRPKLVARYLRAHADADPPYYYDGFHTADGFARPQMEAYLKGFFLPPNCPGSEIQDTLLRTIEETAHREKPQEFFGGDARFSFTLDIFRKKVRSYAATGEWPVAD